MMTAMTKDERVFDTGLVISSVAIGAVGALLLAICVAIIVCCIRRSGRRKAAAATAAKTLTAVDIEAKQNDLNEAKLAINYKNNQPISEVQYFTTVAVTTSELQQSRTKLNNNNNNKSCQSIYENFKTNNTKYATFGHNFYMPKDNNEVVVQTDGQLTPSGHNQQQITPNPTKGGDTTTVNVLPAAKLC